LISRSHQKKLLNVIRFLRSHCSRLLLKDDGNCYYSIMLSIYLCLKVITLSGFHCNSFLVIFVIHVWLWNRLIGVGDSVVWLHLIIVSVSSHLIVESEYNEPEVEEESWNWNSFANAVIVLDKIIESQEKTFIRKKCTLIKMG
jgi:hypothetical protein